MVAQTPSKSGRVLSDLGISSLLALLLTPAILSQLYHYAIREIGAEANPFPNPWRALFLGLGLAFASSFFCSWLAVSALRMIVGRIDRARGRRPMVGHDR